MTLHNYSNTFYTANPVYGGGAGLLGQLHIGKRVTLQPEALYEYHGSEIPDGRYRAHALTVPVNAQINIISQYAGGARVFLIGGGYYRYNFSTRNAGFDGLGLRDEEHGYNFGFGVEAMKIQFYMTGRFGLRNLSRADGADIRHQGSYFSLSYLFNR